MPRSKNIYYIHFDLIDSTNTWAKNNAEALDANHLTCITAQEQSAGRGRFSKKWLSPRGLNIYASLFFCISEYRPTICNLGQILSLSCAKVLASKGFTLKIKWPNDLLLDGKKVAGILTETVALEDRIGIILGIGINVNMTKELLSTLDQPATSLAQLSGHTWTLEQILEPLLQQFLQDLSLWEEQGFAPFYKSYEKLLAFKGQQITCQNGAKKTSGICKLIDENGNLHLKLPTGKTEIISSGELIAKNRLFA